MMVLRAVFNHSKIHSKYYCKHFNLIHHHRCSSTISLRKVHVNFATVKTATLFVTCVVVGHQYLMHPHSMVPECVINMSSVFMRHFSFHCSPFPSHCFGEKLENVTVLQLTCSDLKGPFDCLLPYEDLPLMCWTYAHQLSPEICKYHVLVGKSVKV